MAMASKRLAKSAVNWKAFSDRVSDANLPYFKRFKLLSDTYAGKVSQLPETLPKIDFAHYKSLGAPAAVVDSLEKAYGSAKISYPADTNNTVAKIEKEFDQMKLKRKEFVAEQNESIKTMTEVADVCKKAFPPKDEWTMQLYTAYFPDCMPNPDRPTLFPHTMLNEEFYEEADKISQAKLDIDLVSSPLYRIPYSSTVQNEYVETRKPELSDVYYSIGYNPSKEERQRLQDEHYDVAVKYFAASKAFRDNWRAENELAKKKAKEFNAERKRMAKAAKEAKLAKKLAES